MKNYRLTEKTIPGGAKVMCGTEEQEQQAVMEWASYMAGRYPELSLLHHVPNGGSRNRLEAAKLKRMGVKAGVPDLVLPVPRGGYAGAYIEMKVGRNTTTEKQREWGKRLKEQGYYVKVCYSAREVEEVLEKYLKEPKTRMTVE